MTMATSNQRAADTRFQEGGRAVANDASVYSFDLSSRKCVGISGRGSNSEQCGCGQLPSVSHDRNFHLYCCSTRARCWRQAKEGPPGPLLTGWRLESFLRALQISVAECVLYV